MKDEPVQSLRLDLFLKRSGLVKRRSLAATLCNNDHVTLNARPVGPGKTVKVGDRIQIRYPRRKVMVEVTRIPEKQVVKGEGYKVLSEEAVEEDWF